MASLPLSGIRVLDFSTLLPGPIASLFLQEAGAEVIKVERPQVGDEMRYSGDRLATTSAKFALLNGGKRGLAANLKDPADLAMIHGLASEADVIIEQFRPGVMDSLSLGYSALAALNPRLVYCSITGYGQQGPLAQRAGHDINYMAEAGILGLTRASDGAPILPPILAADVGGGAYPSVINILLALRQRDATGRGSHIDVSMADNLFMFAYAGWAQGFGAGRWPVAGQEITIGGSPRYWVYRTADDEFLAVGCVEERFWTIFLEIIGIAIEPQQDRREPERIKALVADRILTRTADEWEQAFGDADVCVSRVISFEAAAKAATGKSVGEVQDGDTRLPDIPMPIAPHFRSERTRTAPLLAEPGDAPGRPRWSPRG